MTIINDIRIKDRYVHNLPENRDLLCYARKNRRAGNMVEIAFWKQVYKKAKIFHTTDFDVLQHVNIVLADLRKYIVENYEHEDDEKRNKNAYITTPPFGHPLGFAFSPLRSAEQKQSFSSALAHSSNLK